MTQGGDVERPPTGPDAVTAWLDGLDQAREKATPGPWWNESGTVHAPYPFGRNDGLPGAACHPLDAQGGNGRDADADAELAAEAVNALPELVRLAREREAIVRAAYAFADELDAEAGPLIRRRDGIANAEGLAKSGVAIRLRATLAAHLPPEENR